MKLFERRTPNKDAERADRNERIISAAQRPLPESATLEQHKEWMRKHRVWFEMFVLPLREKQ